MIMDENEFCDIFSLRKRLCLLSSQEGEEEEELEAMSQLDAGEFTATGNEEVVAIAEDDVNTGILSQDLFSSQDYCTPSQPQDSTDLDSKDKAPCPQSPVKSTIQRKRCRPEFLSNPPDSIQFSFQRLERVRSEESIQSSSQQLARVRSEVSSSDDFKTPKITASGQKNYVSQSALALRARVMSPPCIKNPYLDENEELNEKIQRSTRRSPACVTPIQSGTCLSRYRADFHELEEIGRGNFSRVYKALNRLDGCCYAVKCSQSELRLDTERKVALMEVQSLAALGPHKNIVGYHTAWFENDHLYIQMELCDHNLVTANDRGILRTDTDFLEAVYQIAQALEFIHGRGVAHLDVKPENIYVRDGTYKLGDFGRATLINGTLHVEEGDARYMSREILNDNYEHLDKVDMFSLGATFFELLMRKQYPGSGKRIDRDTEIKIPMLPGFSIYFQKLLQDLVSNDPGKRPSAKDVLKNPIFNKVRGAKEV